MGSKYTADEPVCVILQENVPFPWLGRDRGGLDGALRITEQVPLMPPCLC